MDFQAYVNCCSVPCAVLSVEKTPEGLCGPIHILCANQTYKDTMGPKYYDGMPYEELVPKDVKFEDYCFRAAHMNERMHAYVQTVALNCWTDQVMIPLEPQGDEIGYCGFLFKFTDTAEPSRIASVSQAAASVAIKASLTLLSADDFKESLIEVIQDVLDMSEALLCRVTLIDHERQEASTFCEKYRDDVVLDTDRGDGAISYEIVSSWEAMIGVSNCVIVKNEAEMDALEERNPDWVKNMRSYGVTSLVLIPLRHAKTVIGYLYVSNFNVDKVVEVKEVIELLSLILGSEIANLLLMNKLEKLSTDDRLTGLRNRNAMFERIAKIEEESHELADEGIGDLSFGIVAADLNGLKRINDQYGHAAGDRLLERAAKLLGSVFRKGDLYRMGGDEFVAIASGVPQDVFCDKVAKLRSMVLQDESINFAIGSYWSDGSVDVRTAFKQADQNMYIDKRAYYEAHPDEKRS